MTFRQVLCSLALVPSFAFAQNASSSSIDLLSFATADAQIIAGAHLDAAKSSALGVFMLSQVQSGDPMLQTFITETGIDPRTDITEVLFAVNGAPGPGSHGLVAAHGAFANSIATIEASAQAKGGVVTHGAGVDVVSLPDGNACIALYTDASTALIGDCASVQAALSSAKAKADTGTPLLAKAALNKSQQDLWFASVLPLGQFNGAVPAPFAGVLNSNLIQGIQQTSGGLKFVAGSTTQGPTVQLAGEALMDTSQNATSLMNVVNFFKGLLQMNNGAHPAAAAIASLLSTLQATATGNTLTVSLTIPQDSLVQLFQTLHQEAAPHMARR
jgi:hypothetical protein